jgi:hypothetical protein
MNLNLSVIRRILMVFFGFCYIIYVNIDGSVARPEAVFKRRKDFDPTKIPLAIVSALWNWRFLFCANIVDHNVQIESGGIFAKGKWWDI